MTARNMDKVIFSLVFCEYIGLQQKGYSSPTYEDKGLKCQRYFVRVFKDIGT